MIRISSALMLVLLTACSRDEPGSQVVSAAAPLAPAVDVHAIDKIQAKAAAVHLFEVMRALEGVVDNSDDMEDAVRYGRYFYRPLETELRDWPLMSDPRFEIYADLNYCRDAARHLSRLGERIHSKKYAQSFLDSARADFKEALPKCEHAIKAYS